MIARRNEPAIRDLVHALAAEHTCELRAEARRERMVRRGSHARARDPISPASAGGALAVDCSA